MNVESLKSFGRALLDYHTGNTEATMLIIRDDGEITELAAELFFKDPESFSEINRLALSLCRGRVLDVGAGTGRHSVVLQARDHNVCAIDIVPEAVQIIRSNGITDVYCTDVMRFDKDGFDTILMLGHGLGISQDLDGLNHLLRKLREVLNNNGIIICDSINVRATDNPKHLAYQESIEKQGRYRGEVQFQIEYKGEKGPFLKWLHVDPDTLAQYAFANGLTCEIMLKEKKGDYLARLVPAVVDSV